MRDTRDKNRKLSEKQQQTVCALLPGSIIETVDIQDGLRVPLVLNSISVYHPFTICTVVPIWTPWIGRQSVTGPFTLQVNLGLTLGQWEETREPRGNLRVHRKSTQTPHRILPRPIWGSNLGTSCANHCTTVPPCSHLIAT